MKTTKTLLDRLANKKHLLLAIIITMTVPGFYANNNSYLSETIPDNKTGIYDDCLINLIDSIFVLETITIIGERPRGKTENNKTIYFINKNLITASGNVPDMLRHIPGIHVDLKQTITLDGNPNIIVLVNGIERNKNYISQLNPVRIDRIEISNTPPANYDGNVSGVINLVLTDDNETGFNGQFFTEIPTSKSIVYSFPNYSLQYSTNRINMFTSYNGEINFENIDETFQRQIKEKGQELNITTIEKVRQKNLSHAFHYGVDFHITNHHIINFYGSINPYSYEQDGKAIMHISGEKNQHWTRNREETDNNLNILNSLYYKRLFNKKEREMRIDISNSHIKANNTLSYYVDDQSDATRIQNAEKPEQVTTHLRIDFTDRLHEKLMISVGSNAVVKTMQNKTPDSFEYHEQVYALYGRIHYNTHGNSLQLGLRAEHAETNMKNKPNKTGLSLLPSITFQHQINERQNLQVSFRRSVHRPNVFQLNPSTYTHNPYSVRKGNPQLQPEFSNRIYTEHSFRSKGNFIAYRLFSDQTRNAINNLTFLNDSLAFETQLHNLGDIHQLGIQFLGSLKFGTLTISPSLRLYHQSTTTNIMSRLHNIDNKSNWVFDGGISSILSLKNDLAISGSLRYSTREHYIQETTHSDALYILAVDKNYNERLKVGIMTALPFIKTFNYQQTAIKATHFSSTYHGKLQLPIIPFMFRVSYNIQTGKRKAAIDREQLEVPKRQKTGF